VSSPIDVGVDRGGFALSMLLDLAEMVRMVNDGFSKKVNIGLEVPRFCLLKKKGDCYSLLKQVFHSDNN